MPEKTCITVSQLSGISIFPYVAKIKQLSGVFDTTQLFLTVMSYDCYEYTIWTQHLFTENSKCNGTIEFESWLTFLVFLHVSSLDEQAELDFPVEFS